MESLNTNTNTTAYTTTKTTFLSKNTLSTTFTTSTLVQTATITGTINMTVSNVSGFAKDPQVLVALVESIATTAGVSEDTVTVARRIHDDSEQIFELSYVITLPQDEPAAIVAESKRIKAAFGLTKAETDANIENMTANFVTTVDQAVGSGFYVIQVRSISIPEVQTESMQPTTTTAPSEEEGKDETGRSGRIIGGIVGAAIALLIAGSCVSAYCYVCRKGRNNRHVT